MNLRFCVIVTIFLNTVFTSSIIAAPIKSGDQHYNNVGFFDIHVCNWPNRPLFFMNLFSTPQFRQVQEIYIYSPENKLVSKMPLDKFRIIAKKGKPEKRVFINQVDINKDFSNGWYTAEIKMIDGSTHRAKDYVIIDEVAIVNEINPQDGAEAILIPKRLQWTPAQGAAYYQIFIRDLWNDGKLILKSKLLDKPYLDIPQGLLEADRWYSWVIHARDSREHVLLGDFNHGSLSAEYKFTTAP